jgi:signal transduction histidine kinase
MDPSEIQSRVQELRKQTTEISEDVQALSHELHRAEPDEIHLTVSDLGKGFDLEAARQGRGLGLTSMQERVRLVNGSIVIQSKPMSGTNIHVRVPFKWRHGAQQAAG